MRNAGILRDYRVYPLVIMLGMLLLAIFWRWEYRSIYYPGWEILGAANGLFLLSTETLWDAIKEAFWLSRHFTYWNHTNSVIFSLIPGYLTRIYPWEFWAHIINFGSFVLVLYLIISAVSLSRRDIAVLFALILCSPSILSHTITGHPYISGFLPHAMVLLAILKPYFREHIIPASFLCLTSIEVSWHTYELGKTFPAILIFAALFVRDARISIRLVWVITALLSIYLVLNNKGMNIEGLINVTHDPLSIVSTIPASLSAMLLEHRIDLPVLPIMALFSLFFISRDRWFWVLCILFQWSLLFVIASRGLYELRPRRFVVLEFFNIIVCIITIRHYFNIGQNSFLVNVVKILLFMILTAGITWQFTDLWKFTRVEISTRSRSLPYTESNADFYIHPPLIKAADGISQLIRQNKHIFLMYSFRTYNENSTDPTALLERVYLKVGHNNFSTHVYIFSDLTSRYSHVPILPISAISTVLNNIHANIKAGESSTSDYLLLDYHGYLAKVQDDEAQQYMNKLHDIFTFSESTSHSIPLFDVYYIDNIDL